MKQRLILLASAFSVIFFAAPQARAQWVRVGAPFDAGITDVIVGDGTNLYTGTGPYGGVFHSTDNGTTWATWIGTNIGPAPDIFAIAISGTNLFAGAGAMFDTGGGVFRSTDSGATWTQAGLKNSYVLSLAAVGTNLLANGELLSKDSGASWGAADSELTYYGAESFAMSGANLFAANQRGVYLSTDSGISWKAVNSGLPDTNILALAVNGANLFAATYPGHIFRSTNYGSSWTAAGSLIDNNIYALVISGSNVFAATEIGVFLSTDNGTSWNQASTGLPASGAPDTYAVIYSLAINGPYLFAGTSEAGVWRRPLSDFAPSSVVEPADSNAVDLSPNPTTGIVTVHGATESTEDVAIANVLGERLLDLPNPHAASFTIDVSSLAPGIYFARFVTSSWVTTKMIVRE